MASSSPTVVVSVLGPSRLDGENFSSHQGIGKSCLCYRFMYPGYDDYQQDHRSLLALHEFESDVAHKDPFLYWGSTTRTCSAKGSSEKVQFEVLEYTVFYQDITEQPFWISNSGVKSITSLDGYMNMALASTLGSPGKMSYKNRDLICAPHEYGSVAFPPEIGKHRRGYVVVIDVSDNGPTFESRLRLTEQMVAHLARRKQKFVVAATKRDEMYFATSLDKLTELARMCKFTLIEVSAKSNVNVSEVFEIVAAKVLGKTVQGLPTHAPTYPDAALKTLSNRDNARRVFRTYLQKRVTVSSELLQKIECTEEYRACAHLHGKCETHKMFAQHVLSLCNDEISTYDDVIDNVGTRQRFFEEYVAGRTDLSPYASYLKDIIIKICQECSNEACINPPAPAPLPPSALITSYPPPDTASPYLTPVITSPLTNGWMSNTALSSDVPMAKAVNIGGQDNCDNGDCEEKPCPLKLLPATPQCPSPMDEDNREYDYPLVPITVPLTNKSLSPRRVKLDGRLSRSPSPHNSPAVTASVNNANASMDSYKNIGIQASNDIAPCNDSYFNLVVEKSHLSGTITNAEEKPYPLEHLTHNPQCPSPMATDDRKYDYPLVRDTIPLMNKSLPPRKFKPDRLSMPSASPHGPAILTTENNASNSVDSYMNTGIQGNNNFAPCNDSHVNLMPEKSCLSGTKLHSNFMNAEIKLYPSEHLLPKPQCPSPMDTDNRNYDYPLVHVAVPLKKKTLPPRTVKADGSIRSPLPQQCPAISISENNDMNTSIQGSNEFAPSNESYVNLVLEKSCMSRTKLHSDFNAENIPLVHDTVPLKNRPLPPRRFKPCGSSTPSLPHHPDSVTTRTNTVIQRDKVLASLNDSYVDCDSDEYITMSGMETSYEEDNDYVMIPDLDLGPATASQSHRPSAPLNQPSDQLQQPSAQKQLTSAQEEEQVKLEPPLFAQGSTLPKPMRHSGVAVTCPAVCPFSMSKTNEDQASVGGSSTTPPLQRKKGPCPPPRVKPPHLKSTVSLHQTNSDTTPSLTTDSGRSANEASDPELVTMPAGESTPVMLRTTTPMTENNAIDNQAAKSPVIKMREKLEKEMERAKTKPLFTASLPPTTSPKPRRHLTLSPTPSPKTSPPVDEDKWKYDYPCVPSTVTLKNKSLPPKRVKLGSTLSLSSCHSLVIPADVTHADGQLHKH